MTDVNERRTPEFYREQAERLTRLADEALGLSLRLELLEMAASFRRLAEEHEIRDTKSA